MTEPRFQSRGIEIWPNLIRFGSASYQLANVSSIRVRAKTRVSRYAIFLWIVGAALAFAAYRLHDQPSHTRWFVALTGAIAVVIGISWQLLRPKKEFTFFLKASSGDGESFVTADREFAMKLKQSIEEAFVELARSPEKRLVGRSDPMSQKLDNGLTISDEGLFASLRN